MNKWLGFDITEVPGGAVESPQLRTLPGSDRLASWAEADLGVVYVVGRGFWSNDVVDAHFRELRRTAAFVRRSNTVIKVLVDLRDASVQSPAVAAKIKNETRLIWSDADRIAVVLQSALARMQITRVVNSGNHASFVALEDARSWLGLKPRERLRA
ncbi:MAG: hypothetical protein EOP89_06860 [Lysobacteraceae bacterium]|nr:MAG: hypothetical protein EOP89_06860 [Xanthomonadaceae bacterium]